MKKWPKAVVDRLNQMQKSGNHDPYFCEFRGDGSHPYEAKYKNYGVLRATSKGWYCPHCDYYTEDDHHFEAINR